MDIITKAIIFAIKSKSDPEGSPASPAIKDAYGKISKLILERFGPQAPLGSENLAYPTHPPGFSPIPVTRLPGVVIYAPIRSPGVLTPGSVREYIPCAGISPGFAGISRIFPPCPDP